MKKIPLTQNQYALVDDADYGWLSNRRWQLKRGGYTNYATTSLKIHYIFLQVSMHRLILGLRLGDHKEVDHIDGNGLNNQRVNLRICSKAENHHNERIAPGFSSEYKGVCWYKATKKWHAQITVNGHPQNLGYFESGVQAALAYNRAATELFGKYARLNRIEEER